MGTDIVEFRQLREVWVFSYLDILCLKGHENGFGCCEAGNGHGVWDCYGTVKKSRLMVRLKIGPCVLLACYCLN